MNFDAMKSVLGFKSYKKNKRFNIPFKTAFAIVEKLLKTRSKHSISSFITWF